MTQANEHESPFAPFFLSAGCALLALSLLDIVNIFVPLRFTDPAWEFQLVSSLVERSPVPLLGVMLVLVGVKNLRIFQFLSKACLVVGILFLLLLPLLISSVWRIQQQSNQQIVQQTTGLQKLKNQLNQAKTDRDINNVLTRLNPQGNTPQIKNPQQVRNQILERIAVTQKRVEAQAANQRSINLNLFRNAFKSGFGALIVGIWFLTVWRRATKLIRSKKQNVSPSSKLPIVNP